MSQAPGDSPHAGAPAGPAPAPAPPAPAPASAPATILIAEDAEEIRLLLVRWLEQLGHKVTAVDDGARVLEELPKAAFDLLLLDIMMPEMSGIEVLERFKAEPGLRPPPVIVISGVSDVASVVRCLELGAEDYLFKPPNRTLLRARIDQTLEQARLRREERQVLERLKVEQERSERLLLSILPEAIAGRLRDRPETIAEHFADASVISACLTDFRAATQGLSAADVVRRLGLIFAEFDRLADELGVERLKTVGEEYIAVAGVPTSRPDHAQAVADLALRMQGELPRLSEGLNVPINLRIGLAHGELVAGVLATARLAYDVWGDAPTEAIQMQQLGLPGAVQTSARFFHRLKDRYMFERRGEFYVPGTGDVETYLLTGKRR